MVTTPLTVASVFEESTEGLPPHPSTTQTVADVNRPTTGPRKPRIASLPRLWRGQEGSRPAPRPEGRGAGPSCSGRVGSIGVGGDDLAQGAGAQGPPGRIVHRVLDELDRGV